MHASKYLHQCVIGVRQVAGTPATMAPEASPRQFETATVDIVWLCVKSLKYFSDRFGCNVAQPQQPCLLKAFKRHIHTRTSFDRFGQAAAGPRASLSFL